MQELAGLTPQQFIQTVRMEYAWQLAEQSCINRVFELADACGYRDTDAFAKTFKKHFGSRWSKEVRVFDDLYTSWDITSNFE